MAGTERRKEPSLLAERSLDGENNLWEHTLRFGLDDQAQLMKIHQHSFEKAA